MEVKHSFLVETCLLTHGLRSIADDEILSAWPDGLSCITWVDEGSIRIGSAAEYILFRRRCRELDFGRIDSEGLEEALSSGGSGALTASGTMAGRRRHRHQPALRRAAAGARGGRPAL